MFLGMFCPFLLALLQAPSPVPAGPVTIELTPRSAAVHAGDTVRLRARVLDAVARPVADAPVAWRAVGEGTVDPTGLVRAGYAGYLRVTVSAGGATALATIVIHPRPTASVEIRPIVRRIVAGTRVTLNGWAFSPDGDRTYEPVEFGTANPRVATITPEGRLVAVGPGSVAITAEAGPVAERITVAVVPNAVAKLTIAPTTTSVRTGDVVRFMAAATDRSGRPITDVFTEWSVAALTYKAVAQIDQRGAFVAAWPGKYTVTADIGGQRADAVIEVRRRSVGSAVEVLGRLPLSRRAEALWLSPGGRCAYIGTDGGPVYVVDVSRPDGVRVVDSMSTGGARVAGIRVAADRPVGVFTREDAPNGGGLVVFDTAEPCRPRPVAEYSVTDSAGIRAAALDGDYAYAADAATGSLRVLDLADPAHPREVARWQTATEPGRRLDDVSVTDGIAYLAYWNDGIVILDVGNGIKGGRPESPALVAQYRYDLNDMYARVAHTRGLGARGTHAARRAGKFVLIADEVRPLDERVAGGAVFGRLNAIDVADPTRPNGVAWYEPTDAGIHDLWVEGDTLYMGASQGGLRVLDLSGELKGDLVAQGREIAWLPTADSLGVRPFRPMTRGVAVREGLVYAVDANSGLWIVRLVPAAARPSLRP
jgi:hypothetical protein